MCYYGKVVVEYLRGSVFETPGDWTKGLINENTKTLAAANRSRVSICHRKFSARATDVVDPVKIFLPSGRKIFTGSTTSVARAENCLWQMLTRDLFAAANVFVFSFIKPFVHSFTHLAEKYVIRRTMPGWWKLEIWCECIGIYFRFSPRCSTHRVASYHRGTERDIQAPYRLQEAGLWTHIAGAAIHHS